MLSSLLFDGVSMADETRGRYEVIIVSGGLHSPRDGLIMYVCICMYLVEVKIEFKTRIY